MEETQEVITGTVETDKAKKGGFLRNFNSDRDFHLFLTSGLLGGIGAGIYSSVFNNFLSDVYKLSADARGVVEFPRELPGVFIMVVLGLLNFLGDIRIALVGTIAAAAGMLGLGLFSPTFALMLVWMMFFSLGQHMVFPVTPSIGMELSNKEEYGMRLGRVSAFSLSGTIVAFVLVWLGFRFLNLSYQVSFIIAAVFNVLSAIALGLMKPRKPEKRTIKFVFRKRYLLYYILCIVDGARKQIFMTFAPWVLIRVFGLEASQFAILGIVVAVVSILTRKIVGRTIDIKGERFILSLEAVILFIICIGYAFAGDVFSTGVAMVIIAACYIIDNSMSAVEMARHTYVRKIAIDPSDVTPTLSTGVSLAHIVSMTMPYLGGLLWVFAGYKYVFIAAGVIALLNLILSRKIET